MERKLVISCRIMHNLIKINHTVKCDEQFHRLTNGANRWMDGLTQRYVHTFGSCNTV